MKGTRLLLAAVAGLTFTLAGAQPANADRGHRGDECYRKIQKAEDKLGKEIRKHGYYSRQARNQRERIYRLRAECSRHGYGRDGYGWRGDNRDRRWGRWDHNPDRCRIHNHRHDRDGGFRWGGTFWLRIR